MEEYSSKVKLTSYQREDESDVEPVVLNGSRYPKKTFKKTLKSDGRGACLLFAGVLLFAFIISTICIMIFYIEKLHQRIEQLEQRFDALEKTLDDDYKDFSVEDDYTGTSTESSKVKSRSKRSIMEYEESSHIRAEHHGIASHHIALIYGDPDAIKLRPGPNEPQKLRFTEMKEKSQNGCGKIYERGDKQYWCLAPRNAELPRYMTSMNSELYSYFVMASWMNHTRARQNFNLGREGKIIVETEGIYIVHASIHFSEVDKTDAPSYSVYKTDRLGTYTSLISKCVVSAKVDDGSGVYPCQAWQLSHLKAEEEVFLRIGPYNWFRIEKETFHLALIKLNNYGL